MWHKTTFIILFFYVNYYLLLYCVIKNYKNKLYWCELMAALSYIFIGTNRHFLIILCGRESSKSLLFHFKVYTVAFIFWKTIIILYLYKTLWIVDIYLDVVAAGQSALRQIVSFLLFFCYLILYNIIRLLLFKMVIIIN